MTAVTISCTRGATYDQPISYTLATSAPTSGFDFELRYNLTDQNGAALTKLDLVRFIEATIYGLNSGTTFFPLANNGTDFVGPAL